MPPSFIPNRDADYDTFLFNFKTALTAAPATYGMVAGDAVAISAQYTNWHPAYVAATNVLTRTRTTIATKDAQRVLSISLLRAQCGIIRANPAVSDANKLALGIPPRDPVPTVIPPPATAPVLSALNSSPGVQSVLAVDTATPTSRAKPAGVIGLLLHKAVGAVAAIDPLQSVFEGLFTRTPATISFAAGDNGKVCTYFARWTNAKGEEGPWSAPVTCTVSF